MRVLIATVVLLCAACGPRHDEDLDFEVERPDRIAADPSIGGGNQLPPPPPPPPPGHTSVSDVRTFAEATPGIYEMALDATHLYWVTDGIFGPSQVWRANRESAATELLATSTGRVYALAIDEAHVYFVETSEPAYLAGGGSVLRVPKAGGGVQTLVAGLDNPTSVAVDDTHVYFTRAFSPDGEVLRAPKTGGPAEVLLVDVDNPWDIAVDATHLYVSEMNRSQILRAPKTGGAFEVIASDGSPTGWMAIGPDDVYFEAASTLSSVPLAGGPVTSLHEGGTSGLKIAFGGAYVLWGRWFIPLDASPSTELLGALGEEIATVGVAGDDRAVFIADHPSGKIFTATVSGE